MIKVQEDKSLIRSEIAGRIRSARMFRGFTQDELASLVHVHKMTLSRWERAILVPNGNDIFNLANALNCSADYLCGLSNEIVFYKEMNNASN